MMVGDFAERGRGLFNSMKSRAQRQDCREICRQTGTGGASYNTNAPPSSPWSYWCLQSRLTLKKLQAHASMRRHYRSLQPWCNPGWCDVFDHMSRNGVSKCCMKLIPVDFYIQNCNIKAGIARSTSILPVAAAVQIAPDIFYDQNLPFILRRYWTDYKYNINVTSILRCTFEASFAYHKYGCTFNNLVCGIFVFGCDSFVI